MFLCRWFEIEALEKGCRLLEMRVFKKTDKLPRHFHLSVDRQRAMFTGMAAYLFVHACLCMHVPMLVCRYLDQF